MTFDECGFPVQGLSQATDISSSDEEVRQAGIKLLTGAIEVSILIGRAYSLCPLKCFIGTI